MDAKRPRGGPVRAGTSSPRAGKALSPPRGTGTPLDLLSPRQTEVLTLLILTGHDNEELGELLGLKPETVKTHMEKILGRLKVKNRTQAALMGVRLGLVSPHRLQMAYRIRGA